MKITLPVYQHPTLVVLVDDNRSLIESIEFQMNPMIAVKSFQDAHEALGWLHAVHDVGQRKFLPIRVGYDQEIPSFERRTISLDVDGVYRIALDARRFYASAVVVVDYDMPQMDGLDFCRALQGLPYKKILFTGEADEMVAVDAFNQGLIDRYLKKSDAQALDRLELEITTLERAYFLERSGTLKDLLVKDAYSFLSDALFATLVNGLMHEHGFVEHYLFPHPTGMLFLDANGKATLMVVETKASLMAQLECAQDYAAPPELLTALRNEAVVPFFWKSGGMYTEQSLDWQAHCKPAQTCAGREDYFWAMFDLPKALLNGPVYPYKQFLRDSVNLPGLKGLPKTRS